jgi:hypothetical protein
LVRRPLIGFYPRLTSLLRRHGSGFLDETVDDGEA